MLVERLVAVTTMVVRVSALLSVSVAAAAKLCEPTTVGVTRAISVIDRDSTLNLDIRLPPSSGEFRRRCMVIVRAVNRSCLLCTVYIVNHVLVGVKSRP